MPHPAVSWTPPGAVTLPPWAVIGFAGDIGENRKFSVKTVNLWCVGLGTPSPCDVSWLFSCEGFDCLFECGCLLQSTFIRLKPWWWVVPFVPVGSYSNRWYCIYMSQQIQLLPWAASCKSCIKKLLEIVRSVAFIFNLKIGIISPTLIKISEKKR